MASGIYLIENDNRLVEMREQAYASEALLQELLAKYPNLLAGDQMSSSAPRRWLLVDREMGLPVEEDGGNRWAVDHLFLDQDSIPTIVEVKRSTDTRIRREVVGQMLDYAANAVAYWPVESVRAALERRCDEDGLDVDLVMAEHVGQDGDAEAFWQAVKLNLQAGRVRLVFVADEMPLELRRVIEFLNARMSPTEVLGVEIKQFVGENLRTLVPRVIGLTAEAEQKKSAGRTEKWQWDEASFLAVLAERRPASEVAVARRILEWAKSRGLFVWWGQGKQDGSFFPELIEDGVKHLTISVWTYGRLEVQLQFMRTQTLPEEGKRRELLRRLNALPAVSLSEDSIDRRPSIPLAVLTEESTLNAFIGILDWLLDEIRAQSRLQAG